MAWLFQYEEPFSTDKHGYKKQIHAYTEFSFILHILLTYY